MVGTAKAGAPVLDPTWERAGVKFPRATRLPLYRQAQMLKRQGITLDRSTLSAWVGRACWWLTPLYELVLGTVLSSDKRRRCRCSNPAREGPKRDASGAMPSMTGLGPAPRIQQQPMSTPRTAGASIRQRTWRHSEAPCRSTVMPGSATWSQHAGMPRSAWLFCWAHARRPFYEFYTSNQSPLAAEVLARIAKLYEIEAGIRGQPPDVRKAVRQLRSRPLVADLHVWLQEHVPRVPGWTDLAKAMRYVLRHWDGLILYLDDGRLEMDTNVVERAIRPVTITRKHSLFAGSDAGARRWAIANTLIQSCKLNDVEPLAYLTDVLQRIVSGRTKSRDLNALLPWNWRSPATIAAA